MSGVPFPQLSLPERDRRWGLAQALLAMHDLDALLVYGEPEGAGVPHFAADNYLTNERTGGVVIVPRDEPPLVLAPVHLAIGGHLEAAARGEDTWLRPEQFVTHAADLPAGAARGGTWIAACLRERGWVSGRIGIVGLGSAAFHSDGIIPAGTWRLLREQLPTATFLPVDADFIALTRCRSSEEQELLRWCAQAGERMCEAMIAASAAGVGEQEIYAAGVAACLRSGAHTSGSVLVLGRDGESVEWGPPRWTYRAQVARTVASGDIIMAELFPVYGMLETQQQLAIAVGRVHPDTARAAEVARASYDAGVQAVRPGVRFEEVVAAMQEPLDEVHGWNLTPLVHSLNPLDVFSSCGLPTRHVPEVARYGPVGGVPTIGGDLQLAPGMAFALEPNCVLGRRRVNIGGTVLVTESGAEELNNLPCELQHV
jgi:Xaa-Pro aminopeptidase